MQDAPPSQQEQYEARFAGKEKDVLQCALDIRKFEIGLYWQRAAYFWTLIAATFAAYFVIISADKFHDKGFFAYIVSCAGFIFTWAWFLVNRGSKFWQENWESHVDLLEKAGNGPLYKTVLSRPAKNEWLDEYILAAAPFSVSKVNQFVGTFTLLVWLLLAICALFQIEKFRALKVIGLLVITGLSAFFWWFMHEHGKTDDFEKEKMVEMKSRKTTIIDPAPPKR